MRTSPCDFIDVIDASTSNSSSDMIGSRDDDWLHASTRAFIESGYWSGTVRSFSIRQPSTRPSITVSMRWKLPPTRSWMMPASTMLA